MKSYWQAARPPPYNSSPLAAASPAAAAPTPAAAAGVPLQGNRTVEGGPKRSVRKTFGQTKTPAGSPPVLDQLPYTGLGLLLFVVLGLGLLASGLGTRARFGT